VGRTQTSTAFYVQDPTQHEEEALRTIEAALAHGVNMLDTAWIYQNQTPDGLTHFNETLVGRAARQLGREKFGKSKTTLRFSVSIFAEQLNVAAVIATKFMPSRMANGATLDGIRQQLTESLSRLDCGHVDLYYMHRVCTKVPIEDIAQSLKQLQVPRRFSFKFWAPALFQFC
jgi:aryl-alcohol dehydrogenase-like predicted oxidoreductase